MDDTLVYKSVGADNISSAIMINNQNASQNVVQKVQKRVHTFVYSIPGSFVGRLMNRKGPRNVSTQHMAQSKDHHALLFFLPQLPYTS
jgi:hypothetical protein